MSKLQLQKLRQIKQSRKDCVSGYIRNDELLKDQQIPLAIFYICILFFGPDCDEFDPKWIGKAITLSNNNTRVEYKAVRMSNIYCKKIIDSGYHEWKFKIVKTAPGCGQFMIGLWRCSKDKTPPLYGFFTSGKDQGYGYSLDSASISGEW